MRVGKEDLEMIRAGWGRAGTPENKRMAQRALELLGAPDLKPAIAFLRSMVRVGKKLNKERGLDEHGKPL